MQGKGTGFRMKGKGISPYIKGQKGRVLGPPLGQGEPLTGEKNSASLAPCRGNEMIVDGQAAIQVRAQSRTLRRFRE